MKNLTCEQRIDSNLQSTLSDLKQLWEAYCNGEEEVEDLGSIYDYGLSFDYVAPETFSDQKQGYFRYQLSYGGPSSEFRFYTNPDFSVHLIEYAFLDWFDGATRVLSDDDYYLLEAIFNFFYETGSVEQQYQIAMDDFKEQY